jgi:HlyD family secretion protein
MTKKKKVVIWIVVAIVVVGGVFIAFRSKNSKPEYLTEKAQKGNIVQTVSVTGELTSENEINLNFETSGRIKEIKTWIGKEVVDGEILATIDDAILNQQLAQEKASLDKAIADAGGNNDIIRETEQSVDNAQDYYDETDDLEDQKVAAAEQNYDNAKDYYDDALSYYNKVVDDNGADSSEAKSAKLTLTTAENNKKTTGESLETAKKTKNLNKTAADNSLKSAKEDLKTAESNYTKRANDASVKHAQAKYQIALKNLEKASLKAPVNGLITKVDFKRGEVLGTASIANPFGKMISKDFILETNIPESDIAKIKIGQKAEIVFDAFSSDEKFTAEIIEIEPASTVIQDVVYYKTKLKLNDVDSRLKSGMSADIDIQIAEKNDIVLVPQQAVKENGKKVVKVLSVDGSSKEVEVKVGLEGDDGNVEIISGLEGNEDVIIGNGEEG